jgi:hypothetical protein
VALGIDDGDDQSRPDEVVLGMDDADLLLEQAALVAVEILSQYAGADAP